MHDASQAGTDQARLLVRGLGVRNLQPVSLRLEAGECIALGGPSGSGKSLILRAIADLDPGTGEVVLDGVDRNMVSGPEWRGQVRYFAAESGWWLARVGDHFVDRHEAAMLLDALGLPEGAVDWTLDRVSTGERQRLALARGLVDRPRVLLLDEPTSGLDKSSARRAEEVIRARLKKDGAAAILVTHDQAQAKRLAGRSFVIRDGAVVEAQP